MGPGTHQDTLDDHFGDWNWKKITVLGAWADLHKKIVEAIKWAKEHSEALASWRRLSPTLITQWKSEIESWEDDNSSPQSFESRFNRKLSWHFHSSCADNGSGVKIQPNLGCR
ncbi:hypothetical protein BDR07DRAFT_1312841 [Suillus spraguei]|nr:hypothetical protein BDR07DRAFT_1312841 [Suillus spraguei]